MGQRLPTPIRSLIYEFPPGDTNGTVPVRVGLLGSMKTGPGLTPHQTGGPGGTDLGAVSLYKNVALRAVILDTGVSDRYHTQRHGGNRDTWLCRSNERDHIGECSSSRTSPARGLRLAACWLTRRCAFGVCSSNWNRRAKAEKQIPEFGFASPKFCNQFWSWSRRL